MQRTIGRLGSWGGAGTPADAAGITWATGAPITVEQGGVTTTYTPKGAATAEVIGQVASALPGILALFKKPAPAPAAPVVYQAPAPVASGTPGWVWGAGGVLTAGVVAALILLLRRPARRRNPAYGWVPIVAAAVAAAGTITGAAISLAATNKAKAGTPEQIQAQLLKKQRQLARTGLFAPSAKKKEQLAAEIAQLESALALAAPIVELPSAPAASGIGTGALAGLGIGGALLLTLIAALVLRRRR